MEKGMPSMVETNMGVLEKLAAIIMPDMTWYWRSAVTRVWFLAISLALGISCRNMVKASSEGARIVMFWAVESICVTAGTVARRAAVC